MLFPAKLFKDPEDSENIRFNSNEDYFGYFKAVKINRGRPTKAKDVSNKKKGGKGKSE